MDSISLYYFSELAKDLNMTKTATRLFLSQQTLSNHISRLEESCGTKLFERKPRLSLTFAGETVLAFATKVLQEQTNLQDMLYEISNQEKGMLAFGASKPRLDVCLPHILPRFSARYPNVALRIVDNVSVNLEPMVLNNEIDIAVVASPSKNALLASDKLVTDKLYICVSDDLIQKYCPQFSEAQLAALEKNGTTLKTFSALPFCLLNNRMGNMIRSCFWEEGIRPNAPYSASYVHIGAEIAIHHLAASFISYVTLIHYGNAMPPGIRLFPILHQGDFLTQEMYLIHRTDRYMPKYALFFTDLLHAYFSKSERSAKPEQDNKTCSQK